MAILELLESPEENARMERMAAFVRESKQNIADNDAEMTALMVGIKLSSQANYKPTATEKAAVSRYKANLGPIDIDMPISLPPAPEEENPNPTIQNPNPNSPPKVSHQNPNPTIENPNPNSPLKVSNHALVTDQP